MTIVIATLLEILYCCAACRYTTRANVGTGALWLLDTVYGAFTDTVMDPTMIPTVRAGRIGLLFITLASCLLVLGVNTFIPQVQERIVRKRVQISVMMGVQARVAGGGGSSGTTMSKLRRWAVQSLPCKVTACLLTPP